jgi:hypothetical protein
MVVESERKSNESINSNHVVNVFEAGEQFAMDLESKGIGTDYSTLNAVL